MPGMVVALLVAGGINPELLSSRPPGIKGLRLIRLVRLVRLVLSATGPH